jgi:hypothetical protein
VTQHLVDHNGDQFTVLQSISIDAVAATQPGTRKAEPFHNEVSSVDLVASLQYRADRRNARKGVGQLYISS